MTLVLCRSFSLLKQRVYQLAKTSERTTAQNVSVNENIFSNGILLNEYQLKQHEQISILVTEFAK